MTHLGMSTAVLLLLVVFGPAEGADAERAAPTRTIEHCRFLGPTVPRCVALTPAEATRVLADVYVLDGATCRQKLGLQVASCLVVANAPTTFAADALRRFRAGPRYTLETCRLLGGSQPQPCVIVDEREYRRLTGGVTASPSSGK